MADFWLNKPVLGWAIDDWQAFNTAMFSSPNSIFRNEKNLLDYINRYKQQVFDNYIQPMFIDAPLPLNLGGQTDKTKLIATSVPQGVFDFSLAAQGLYRVPEYYSPKLAQEYPNKFQEYGTIGGVVPPNLVRRDTAGFYYQDDDGRFPCNLIQKGKAEVDMGIKGARLKFGTRTKKVYLTFRRNRGKVKYVEIYSLFYYTSLEGDAQYGIRHLPALMATEYLESIGIKVRFYMTRFVELDGEPRNVSIREKWQQNNNVTLPLYSEAPQKRNNDYLLVQPIIAKEFGEEINYPLFFNISSRSFDLIYDSAALFTFGQELTRSINTVGQPNFPEDSIYREGFERYVNKYQTYNKLGIFKSKEILPEAMLFFHDLVIKMRFNTFVKTLTPMMLESRGLSGIDERTKFVTTNVIVSPFFNWWMRLSANAIKNKVILINSNELVKDLRKMESEIQDLYAEYQDIINKIPDPTTIRGARQYQDSNGVTMKQYLTNIGRDIMYTTNEDYGWYGYNLVNRNTDKVDIKVYVSNMITEITTYADGLLFETEEERKEKRDQLGKDILEALQKI